MKSMQSVRLNQTTGTVADYPQLDDFKNACLVNPQETDVFLLREHWDETVENDLFPRKNDPIGIYSRLKSEALNVAHRLNIFSW